MGSFGNQARRKWTLHTTSLLDGFTFTTLVSVNSLQAKPKHFPAWLASIFIRFICFPYRTFLWFELTLKLLAYPRRLLSFLGYALFD